LVVRFHELLKKPGQRFYPWTIVFVVAVGVVERLTRFSTFHEIIHLFFLVPLFVAALTRSNLWGCLAVVSLSALKVTSDLFRDGSPMPGAVFAFFLTAMVTYGLILWLMRVLLAFGEQSSVTGAVRALSGFLHARDAYTEKHSTWAANLAWQVAQELGLSPRTCYQAYLSALMHDVGKISVPDAVLFKPGHLNPDEWVLVKKHPEAGAAVLKGIPGLEEVRLAVLHHHERWDGKGYPAGLSGEAIPLLARIVCATDALEAMTHDRPYRAALPLPEAIAELKRGVGTQFDPQVVAVLLRVLKWGRGMRGNSAR
jgi:HD-GYP domain-containing protein (c-di-GMP phosphodiesterase class II)